MLSDPPEGAAALAAIELGVDDERCCPHCGAGGAVKRGKARGLRRFRCKECGKTFGALTGTALSGLHHKERWLAFGASLAEGETIKASAERCEIAPSTAHRWRHRFLAAVRQAPDRLAGIVEADETFVLESRKGERKLERKARRRGGKAKKRGSRASRCRSWSPPTWRRDAEPHPARADCGQREGRAGAGPRPGCLAGLRRKPLLSARRGGARHPSREHQRLGWRAGPGRAAHPDGQQPPQPDQGFLRARRGIATKYLDSYLRWFHLIELGNRPSPRACLEAAMTRPYLRLRIEPSLQHLLRLLTWLGATSTSSSGSRSRPPEESSGSSLPNRSDGLALVGRRDSLMRPEYSYRITMPGRRSGSSTFRRCLSMSSSGWCSTSISARSTASIPHRRRRSCDVCAVPKPGAASPTTRRHKTSSRALSPVPSQSLFRGSPHDRSIARHADAMPHAVSVRECRRSRDPGLTLAHLHATRSSSGALMARYGCPSLTSPTLDRRVSCWCESRAFVASRTPESGPGLRSVEARFTVIETDVRARLDIEGSIRDSYALR